MIELRASRALRSLFLLYLTLGCTRTPEVQLRGLRLINVQTDKLVSLDSYQGRPVVVVVWATYCAPCRRELPALERTYVRFHSRGLEVVAISIDDNPASVVRSFANHYGLTFQLYHDRNASVVQRWRIEAVPETIVLDRHGRTRRFSGEIDWDSAAMQSVIAQLLANQSARVASVE